MAGLMALALTKVAIDIVIICGTFIAVGAGEILK